MLHICGLVDRPHVDIKARPEHLGNRPINQRQLVIRVPGLTAVAAQGGHGISLAQAHQWMVRIGAHQIGGTDGGITRAHFG